MGKNALKYYYRSVNNYTEVDGAKTHQVCRHSEHPHKYETEEHCQGDYRCHNDSCPYVSEKDHQHDEHYYRSLDEVVYNGRDVAIDQFRTVKIRLDGYSLRKNLLHPRHTLLKGFRHHVGIGTLKHHGNTSHTLAFTIDSHCPEAFWSTKVNLSYVADMHRHSATVCHHNFLDVLLLAYHTLRPDVISPTLLLNIAAARVLVVVGQRFKHIANGYL